MQEGDYVNNYNIVANNCHEEVVNNIEDIVATIDDYEYDSRSKNKIRVTFLKHKSPDLLEEIGYSGRFDNSKLIKLKVDEILGI